MVYKYSKTPYRFTLLADLQSTILPNTTYLGSTEELTCAERGNYCLIKGWNGLLDNSTGAWVGNWSAYTVANGKLRPVRIGPLLTKVYKFALKKVNFQNDEYYFDTHVV